MHVFRVYLIDRLSLFLDSLSHLLSAEPDMEVIGTSTDSDHAYVEICELEPDLVLLDIELPGRGAMALAGDIRRRFPSTKLVFLAGFLSHVCIDEALRIKASGFLLKSDPVQETIVALRGVFRGETQFSADVQRTMSIDSETRTYRVDSISELTSLTERQLEVLRQLSRGRSVKQVAQTMNLSERAIESHKYRIMRKLDIHDRVDLALFAVREGLLVPQ